MTTESAMAVAVDLSKDFDSINHNLLLAKLKAYGLSQSALTLMSSYLLGRKQRVCLHDVCSSYSELEGGASIRTSTIRAVHITIPSWRSYRSAPAKPSAELPKRSRRS